VLLHDYLRSQARTRPQEVALIVGSEYVTYESLDRSSTNLACALKKRGVARADRVALFLPNSKETVLGIFAALKADAAFVPLNATVKFEKLTAILNDCRPTALITGSIRHIDPLSLAERVPSLKVVVVCDTEKPPSEERFLFFRDALEQGGGTELSSQNIDIDLACVIYTSGSTGIPKGVMMAHRNVLSVANSIISYLDNTVDDIILNCLPLSFVYGLYQVLMSVIFGGTVVLEKGFSYPQVIIEKLKEFKATGFPLVPTMAVMLLEMEAFNGRNLPDLRYITSAGAPLPVKYIKKMQTLFPHTKIYPMYGLTECARVSYLPPEQTALRPSSVGKGMPNEEVWVVDETGSPVSPGETGELVVRGSNVMLGYWERPEETAKVLRQGKYPGERVLYTGDLFRSDNEGYLYFVGRKDDMIKTRGERVSPAEIERTLLKMACIKEVAVIGVPDPLLDQTIVAHVVPTSSAKIDAQSVKKFAAEHLEDCMVPKFVEIVSILPQNSSGKIDKRLLKDEFLSKRPIGKDVEGP
jgi:long-chain acyl-CoA synthetase